MAVFNFDQVDEYVQGSGDGFNFLKLADNGWIAKVRFMYGPGETFQGESVHNVSQDPKKPKYIPCLRDVGQPLEVCPLCKAGVSTAAQFYIPLYVISISKCINGITQPEEPVNQVMLFQRGKTFSGSLSSAVRQSAGTPLVSNVFNIVRNGKAGDMKTTYSVEFVTRDNTTLDQLPERPQVKGSYILPDVTYEDMFQYVPSSVSAAGVMPRPATTPQQTVAPQPLQPGQVSTTAPGIPF